MVVPARPLGIGHLTDDELTRGDLVADVLEQPLACVFLSFASRFGHRLLIVQERGFHSRANIRFVTAETHANVRFPRAIERRALWMAEDAAREVPELSLEDALQLAAGAVWRMGTALK